MAFPEVAWHPEGEIPTLPTTTAQDYLHQVSDDIVMAGEPHDTATDYTTYSTKGLYGIFEASVREHPDRGTEAEIRLNLSAMELIMDLAIAIALVVFMYYAYGLVAKEYGVNSHGLALGSHGVIHVQCTCSTGRLPITDIRSFMK
ncbi:hypothetical protein F4679DRAFT_586621 [Xylaria curta]|nr:hypothetical protein F4679DRAFT_586621 [Xylaria curta]